MAGRLEVITGCMFSGKTGEMIRRLERAAIAGQGVACYKPSIDGRYSVDHAVTHYGRTFPAAPVAAGAAAPEDLPDEGWQEASVVAFDECNLFGEGLVTLAEALVGQGKRVVASGLDQDFSGSPFPPMPTLMSLADDLLKLTAVCTVCGMDATRSQRLVEGRPAPAGDPVIRVGGGEAYEARCRSHHEVPS